MSKIAAILEFLDDGKWHAIDEMRQKTQIDANQIGRIVEFLGEYGFILMDKTTNKIKLERIVQKFLTQTTTS